MNAQDLINEIEREFKQEEQKIWDNQPQDEKQQELDLMTDTNIMFYRRKHYFKECGFGYLFYEKDASKRITFEAGKPFIWDSNLKGDLDLKYEI